MKEVYTILTLGLCCLALPHSSRGEGSPSPMILVPGLGGSRIYLQGPRERKPKLVWLNLIYLIWTSKMTKLLKLDYNRTSHSTYNPNGYQYVTRGWGSTFTIERLSPIPGVAVTDYKTLIKKILWNPYYKRNQTLRGAPYDFRKAPNELTGFFKDLQRLVEETYETTGHSRLVVVGHSLGCLYSLSFFTKVPDEWKRKYVKSYVCVSGPLAGAVKSLLMESIGNAILKFQSPIKFREFERTFPSTLLLFPKEKYFGNRTLIRTPQKKYTTHSYKELFMDMGIEDGYVKYQDVKDLVHGSQTPSGINQLYCFHGSGIDTIDSFKIKNFNDTHPQYEYGPGDGTVNEISLQICKEWKNVQYHVIEGANHKNILHNDVFVKALMTILSN